MEAYKKSVDSQHAPEELIARTLQRIHEEEHHTEMKRQTAAAQPGTQAALGQQAEQTPSETNAKKRKNLRWIGAVGGMAAGLALVAGIWGNQSRLYYNQIPETSVRDIAEEGMWIEDTMSVEEYSAYLGMNLTDVSEDVQLIGANIYVRYDTEGTDVIEDEGTFYYSVDGNQVMVKMSGTLEVAPEELIAAKPSEWEDMMVYAGKNTAGSQLFAAVDEGNVNYFVMGLNLSEKEFENFLKKYF